MSPKPKTDTAAAVDTCARKRGSPRAMAMAHLATILADAKASQARKDKAARLILTHSGAAPSRPKRAAAGTAVQPKGKKEVARDDAAAAVESPSKWTGLLQ